MLIVCPHSDICYIFILIFEPSVDQQNKDLIGTAMVAAKTGSVTAAVFHIPNDPINFLVSLNMLLYLLARCYLYSNWFLVYRVHKYVYKCYHMNENIRALVFRHQRLYRLSSQENIKLCT